VDPADEPACAVLLAQAEALLAAAHDGQIVVSSSTASLVRHGLPAQTHLRPLGAYRLRDSARDEHVFDVVHPDLPNDFPLLQAPLAHPTNLPAALTSFIGRDREQAALLRALAHGRLVALVGAGGCGKTRLALQIAGQLVPSYQEGVWMVELAAIAAGAGGHLRVARALAAALGLREETQRSLLATLTAFLAPRHVLLLVDNCEHVVAACASLAADLLAACPHLQVLATSREHLRVPGEVVYHVGSLTVPPPGAAAAELPRYDAAVLFVERARDAGALVENNAADTEAIVQICRRLDGIPLAIELAAARTGTLSVRAIAARLDDCFRLLCDGPQTVLPRHRTLRATLDWSYGLLEERERTLLRRLAVFAGGWTLEAAETVCGDGEAPGSAQRSVAASDILDLLSALIRKSVALRDGQNGVTRYRLLEPTRQYAAEKLEASEEACALRDRHLAWCVGLAEQAGPGVEREGGWLSRLEQEHDNLRAALTWSLL
jgi:predicted ATPase